MQKKHFGLKFNYRQRLRESLHQMAFENHHSLQIKKIIDAYRIVNANSSMLRWGYCLSLSVNICFNSHINMHFSMQFRFSTISTGISTAWQEWLHKSKYALFGHVLFAAECLYLRIVCYFTHIRWTLACERHADSIESSREFHIQQIYNFVAMFASFNTTSSCLDPYWNGMSCVKSQNTEIWAGVCVVHEQWNQPSEKLIFPKLVQCCRTSKYMYALWLVQCQTMHHTQFHPDRCIGLSHGVRVCTAHECMLQQHCS